MCSAYTRQLIQTVNSKTENLVLDFHSSKLFARAMSLFKVSGVGHLGASESFAMRSD